MDYIKESYISGFGEIINSLINVYTDSESKIKLSLLESEGSEKKWKALMENNEKIIEEKVKEKDDLMTQIGTLELKLDQLQRDLKAKDNDVMASKNLMSIEINNIKKLNEELVKEKAAVIEEQIKVILPN